MSKRATPRTAAPYSVTIPEAAEKVGLSPETLRKHIRAGQLRAKKSSKATGGKTLVRLADLDAWWEALEDA